MRRSLIFFISVMTLLCFCTAALANEVNRKINSQDEAISHAVQLFPEIISGKENLLQVDFSNDRYFGGDTWGVIYHRNEPGPNRLLIRFNAVTGQLVDFSYSPEKYSNNTQVLSRDEAKKIAEAFIKKHHPDKIGKITEQERQPATYYNGRINLAYYFNWHQLIDGKQFDANMMSVGVNALSGDVLQFYCRWLDNVDIPQHPVMDRDTLTNQVVNTLGLYPCYVIDPGSASTGARLVYKLNTTYNTFDGASGNPLDYEGKETSIEEARLFTQQFTPVPAAATGPERQLGQGAISLDKFPQIAEAFFKKIGLEGTVKRTGGGSSSGPGYSTEFWSYSVEQGNNLYESNEIEVGIDIHTGEIVNYNNRRAESRNTVGEVITRDKALATATEFLSIVNLENINNMVLKGNSVYDTGEPVFRFNWVRLVNGVPLMDDLVHATVDQYTGKVINYHKTQRTVNSFADTKGIISPDQALQAFLKAQPFTLIYNSNQTAANEPAGKVRLVYANTYDLAVDARTGEIITTYGENPDLDAYDKKLNNHWARLPLALLADNRLLPEPEVFEPNGSVTRREGLRVLCAIPGEYNYDHTNRSPFSDVPDNDKDLEAITKAVQYNVVESGGTLRPDATLTREDLAVWLVNMLGHQEVAEAQGLSIGLDYRDTAQISSGKEKYVAIASGLKLIDGDADGNFRPQSPVTWGELAGVVIKVVPRLAK